MKKAFQIFFSTLLLLSISWQCGAKTVIYFNFKRHQKELAETVCENKNKVGSCCKAKCYLEKEIKKEDKRQSDLPSSIKEKIEKPELFSGFISFQALQSTLVQVIVFKYLNTLPNYQNTSVFHPPTIG